MAPVTVMAVVAVALLCAALALALAVLGAIASLVGLLPARVRSTAVRDRDGSREVGAPAGDVPGQRA